MNPVEDRENRSSTYHQANRAGRDVYATQHGDQHFNNNHYNSINVRAHRWTGWAVLVVLVLDVVFYFYGKAAYTGHPGDSGDLWRAGISLALLATTGTLIRRWFRTRI